MMMIIIIIIIIIIIVVVVVVVSIVHPNTTIFYLHNFFPLTYFSKAMSPSGF
jgi:hypothetical protein